MSNFVTLSAVEKNAPRSDRTNFCIPKQGAIEGILPLTHKFDISVAMTWHFHGPFIMALLWGFMLVLWHCHDTPPAMVLP